MTDDTPKPPSSLTAGIAARVSCEAKAVKDGFSQGDATNKIAVLSGLSAGATFTVQGARNVRSGLTKDARTGKRDVAGTVVGAVELAAGLFLTGTFYHNMRLNRDVVGRQHGSEGALSR